ncbi:MAG: DeoR/GlpR transcriptional regulator [Moritella sp.]|uniref:DeoR/GlpR family DNA-binding transcription regulator n=1 Tax=Moritella sp. TaxID=78556 RepID=UPI001DD4CA3D|nr:DeoR/GlpR family DNA-binding transcription regulator [Moritella sp.]NQZ51564.1 DeoR/GlpR transcriptional regulator [Moritella sp.]
MAVNDSLLSGVSSQGLSSEDRMKSAIERRMEIVNIVGLQGKAHVEELAKLFNVSGSTIRADFRFLEKGGFIVRSHGIAIINKGAVKQFSKQQTITSPIEINDVNNAVEKINVIDNLSGNNEQVDINMVSLLAAQMSSNETVYIDGSPLIRQLVQRLPRLGKLVVLTNSINLMTDLVTDLDKQVILPGGIVNPESMTLTGSQVEASLRRYRFNKAIISIDGFNTQMGYFVKSEFAADIIRVVAEISQEVILVVSANVLNDSSSFWVGDKNMASTVITEQHLDTQVRTELEKSGVTVLTA